MAQVKLYNYRYSSTFHNKTRAKMDEVVLLHKWRSEFNRGINEEYYKFNLAHAYYLLLFYGFDNIK